MTPEEIRKWNSINRIDGTGLADSAAGISPRPTMVEIERLALGFGRACFIHCKIGGDVSVITTNSPACAALMAAIRQFLPESQPAPAPLPTAPNNPHGSTATDTPPPSQSPATTGT